MDMLLWFAGLTLVLLIVSFLIKKKDRRRFNRRNRNPYH